MLSPVTPVYVQDLALALHVESLQRFFRHMKVMSKFLQRITKRTSQGPGTGEAWYSARESWLAISGSKRPSILQNPERLKSEAREIIIIIQVLHHLLRARLRVTWRCNLGLIWELDLQ